MVENPALVTNPLMGVGQRTIRSITPLARLLADYVVTIDRRDLPLADGAALIAQLRSEPGKLNIAVAPGRGQARISPLRCWRRPQASIRPSSASCRQPFRPDEAAWQRDQRSTRATTPPLTKVVGLRSATN
jgi:hypothetical protein